MTTRRSFFLAVLLTTVAVPALARAQAGQIVFRNVGRVQIEILWLNPDTGAEVSYGIITPGASVTWTTIVGHVWRFRVRGGAMIAEWRVTHATGTLSVREHGVEFSL